jgi:hypothetical protein
MKETNIKISRHGDCYSFEDKALLFLMLLLLLVGVFVICTIQE